MFSSISPEGARTGNRGSVSSRRALKASSEVVIRRRETLPEIADAA